jgi:hypothetical protein
MNTGIINCIKIRRNITWFKGHFPKECVPDKMNRMLLATNGLILNDIKQEDRNPIIYKIALITFPELLAYVPNEFKNKELCEMVVKKNGLLLEFVPKQLITVELCTMALTNNVLAIFHVPTEVLSVNKNLLDIKQECTANKDTDLDTLD